ncbi:hypothetical protein BC830DRAFT_1104577 [Chytriomyces sp. MP71]|nr:hypothetical protein BC830DRAFT_1104577 [Chytriomyces sp. MP71]
MIRTGRTRVHQTRWRKRGEAESHDWLGRFVRTFVVTLCLASAPALLTYLENALSETTAAVAFAQRAVVSLPIHERAETANVTPRNSLVFASGHELTVVPVVDPGFSLQFDGAIRVRRNTEYCQWQEFSTSETVKETDSDGREQTTTFTTYYYNKGWYPHLINSFLFDQPAAHHNPMRDPFPTHTFTASSATLGVYEITSPVLESVNEGWSTRKRFPPDQLETMLDTSRASVQAGFNYVGNGYFYSEYTPSHTETFLRAAGMALEGSLFDFQIADAVNSLFGSCTPGDIRVSFDAIVASPEAGAAVVGKLNEGNQIGVFVTKRGFKLGLFANSAKETAKSMLNKLLSKAWLWMLGGYAFAAVWAFVVTYFYPWKPLESTDINNDTTNNKVSVHLNGPGDWYVWVAEAVSLWLVTAGSAKALGSDDTFLGISMASLGLGLLMLSGHGGFRGRVEVPLKDKPE